MTDETLGEVERGKPARQVAVSWLTRLNEYRDPNPSPSANSSIRRQHFIAENFRPFEAKLDTGPDSIIGTGDNATVMRGVFRGKEIAVLFPNIIGRRSDDSKMAVSVGLMQQAEILKTISNHPNIPSFVGTGPLSGLSLRERSSLIHTVKSIPDIVLGMEYIDGPDVHDRIISGEYFSFDEVKSSLGDISSALEYAHVTKDPYGEPLVHGDISTKHIKYDSSGKPYLLDWGSVGAISEHNNMPSGLSWLRSIDPRIASGKQSGVVLTAPFTAPELIKLDSSTVVTSIADTYSFAAVAYFMLTNGQHPFLLDKDHLIALGSDLLEHMKEGNVKYVPLSERDLKDWPEGVDITKVDEAIEQALSHDPKDRQDVAGFYQQAFVDSLSKR